MRRARRSREWLLALVVLATLAAVRVAIAPRRLPRADLVMDGPARERAGAALRESILGRDRLLEALADRPVVLVGENHFLAEPPAWLTQLLADLHARDGRPAVLLLELPGGMQGDLDAYRARGDETALTAAWRRDALPYLPIVRWARQHPEAVRAVVACDENGIRVALMRALGTDTRNATMAAAITRASRENPDARIVAYGGMAHMMMAGRYLYDAASRSPVGARLLEAGMARRDVAAVWLVTGRPPVEAVWPAAGAVKLDGPAAALPPALLLDVPVTGAERAGELADFAVFLGEGTSIDGG